MNPLSKTIGRCIYCGSTEGLTIEHVVPFALGGTLELAEATCESCRKETARFESRLLQDSLGPARTILQYPTRNKKKRQAISHHTVQVVVDGVQQKAEIPIEDMIALVPALDAGIPTYLSEKYFPGNPYMPTGLKGAYVLQGARADGNPKQALERIGASSINLQLHLDVFDFARLLAKVAHGHAVARFGLHNIDESFLPSLILGDIADPWRYVGGQVGRVLEPMNPQTNPDAIAVSVLDGDILAHIQLFVPLGGPEYLVAVGRATSQLRLVLRSVGDPDA